MSFALSTSNFENLYLQKLLLVSKILPGSNLAVLNAQLPSEMSLLMHSCILFLQTDNQLMAVVTELQKPGPLWYVLVLFPVFSAFI